MHSCNVSLNISQLIRYARASSNYSDFQKRHLHLRNRLLDQGYKKIRLIRSLKKFIFRYQYLVEIYSVSAEKIISNQLRDVNTICRRSWYIAAQVWKIYDFKIEVVPLIINYSTELTTVVGRSCIGGLFNFQLWRIYQWKLHICLLWRDTVSAGRRHTNGYELYPSSSRFICMLI
jgi:hypothetical protein